MAHSINNISFELNEFTQDFSFTRPYSGNIWSTANLQLPNTGDSVNLIDGIEKEDWDDEEYEVLQQLIDFYFDSFKDIECAAAGALLAKNIIHVEQVDELYVAFTEAESFVIKASRMRDYYNKQALFNCLDDFEDPIDDDLTEIKRKGKKVFFKDLNKELDMLMQESLDAVEAINIDDAWIESAFDEILHSFMKSNFCDDYDDEENEVSLEYYENHGCGIRADLEREAREKMNQAQ